MTAEEKKSLLNFFNLAADYLETGFSQDRDELLFEDDPEGDFSSLPLAYQVAEEDLLDKEISPEGLTAEINACNACALEKTRTHTVPGEGVDEPLVMVIGEAPGAEEDASGRPFVGNAGQLLDRMLASIGLSRNKNCYIANIIKCRPPHNRDPLAEEINACGSYLDQQIRLLKPKIILCAGRFAARHILGSEKGINRLRGSFGVFEIPSSEAIPVLPTYHPSALLRDESLKRPAFEDLKLLMARLAGLDKDYAEEVKDIINKYAGSDEDFAARIQEYRA